MKPYYDVDGITIYHGDCRDAAKVAERAGAGVKGARQTGHRWLTMADVAEAIEAKLAARSVRTQITSDDVVQRLHLLASAELPNAMSWDVDGKRKVVPSDQLSPAERAAVRSITVGDYGPDIRLSDPAPYLEDVGRTHRRLRGQSAAGPDDTGQYRGR